MMCLFSEACQTANLCKPDAQVKLFFATHICSDVIIMHHGAIMQYTSFPK